MLHAAPPLRFLSPQCISARGFCFRGRLLLVFAFLSATLLAACATLTEDECRAGHWYEIGLEDGANGRLPSHIEAHAKACADLGIAPVQSDWEKGRQQGLKQYCTVEVAYSTGRRGRSLSPVCPATDLPALQSAHARGLEWYRITERIDDLEDDIRDINAELRSLAADDPRALSLRSERQFLRLRILSLESERRRYGPP